MHRIIPTVFIAALLIAALIAVDSIAQVQNAADEVLAENAFVKLTRADYETELLRIPPEQRAEFAKLAGEISDDPSAKTNRGELGWFGAGTMDPMFTKAAFALKNVGDISEPVLTPFGYHLVRLDGRRAERQRPFEQASKEIMAEMKQRYIRESREAKINAISNDPNMKVNQAAVDALVVKLPEVPKLTAPRPQAAQ